MRTFQQFKTDTINQVWEECRKEDNTITKKEVEYGVTSKRWWDEEILPALKKEEEVPPAVCRSIVKNGGGFSLEQICKHYPKSVSFLINPQTGLFRKRGWD